MGNPACGDVDGVERVLPGEGGVRAAALCGGGCREAVPSLCTRSRKDSDFSSTFSNTVSRGGLGSSGQNRRGWELRLNPFGALGHSALLSVLSVLSQVAGLPGTALPIMQAPASFEWAQPRGLPVLGIHVFPAQRCLLPVRLLREPRALLAWLCPPATSASLHWAGSFDLGHSLCSEQLLGPVV